MVRDAEGRAIHIGDRVSFWSEPLDGMGNVVKVRDDDVVVDWGGGREEIEDPLSLEVEL